MACPRVILLTCLTMTAFAGNSLLCRLALSVARIDPASFTTLRLLSGALVLALLAGLSRRRQGGEGSWLSACALFGYAAGFSFAYLTLTTATGALLLFGAVQLTMLGAALKNGERLARRRLAGLLLACGGLLLLLLPGWSAPPLAGALQMIAAGIAWGLYSLRGRGAGDPLAVTAGNFRRASLLALLLSLLLAGRTAVDLPGAACAIASGAVASGLGYALWYTVLPWLTATRAASCQLSVPVLAALGGVLILGEPLSARLAAASVAVLGGIALVIRSRRPDRPPAGER